jgi:uncharacterized membrane protein
VNGKTNSQEGRGSLSGLAADWPALLLILGGLAAGVLLYSHLPDRVPSHWNIRGEVDAYSSRFWGAFGIPLMNAGIYVLMSALPSIDPRRQNYAKFAGTYRQFKLLMAVFFTGLYSLVIANSLGYRVPVDRVVPFGISLLFLVIGNFMGQIRHNYFVGIKTPWTLANEEVWRKTHRLGGFVWVASGVAGMVGALVGGTVGLVLLITAFSAAVVLPVVYSYIEFKRQGG